MPNQYAQPALGYGKQTEASIDAVNRWMRSEPWYQQIRGTSAKLSESQRTAILRAAQAHGVVIDEGDIQVDASGNLDKRGHAVRNTLIVAGIAGATLATMGAAGVFSGAAAAGAGASSAAGAGVGAATTGAGVASGAGISGSTGALLAGGAAGASKVKNWLAPLLQIGVPVAGSLVGAGMEARGNREAFELADKRAQEAIAYEKEQDAYNRKTESDRYGYSRDLEASRYGNMESRLAPYLSAGASSSDRMSQLLGLPARPSSVSSGGPAPMMPTGPAAGAPVAPKPTTQPVGQPGAALPAEMVTIQAPNGQQRAVPKAEVPAWTMRGAVVVGQAA